ncbi:MAG TPA: polysaccharide deacetylase family protein [Burkholderiaceae bacterium]|nr:polysaccharide deacetylase family protein [Burkholderiaceae bacterium]
MSSEHAYYPRSVLHRRAPLGWPAGKALALCLVVSLEYYELRQDPAQFVPPNLPGLFGRAPYPDVGSYSRRAYGNRVGFFRLADSLDRFGCAATAALDSSTARRCPAVVRRCLDSGWEIAAHGFAVNRVVSSRTTQEQERRLIADSVDVLTRTCGTRPVGWHGAEYGESADTPTLLAEAGFEYCLDWPNDEQPVAMQTGAGPLMSVPMSADLDDVNAHWHRRISMRRWAASVLEAVERLAEDGRQSGRLLALNLHPWLIGHPFRMSYVDELLDAITRRDDVWIATAGQAARWAAAAGDRSPAPARA